MHATKLLSLTSSKVLACISLIIKRAAFALLLYASQAYAQKSQATSISDEARVFSAKALAHGAEVALRERNYDLGIILLRSAIASNPDNAGANYDLWAFDAQSNFCLPRVTDEELARSQFLEIRHGHVQLNRMISDRPAMGAYLNRSDELWNWATRKYSSKILVSPLIWDSEPPDDPMCSAQHFTPYDGEPGKVCITDFPYDGTKGDKPTAFEILWSFAAFELHNIENSKDFLALYHGALRGTISEEEYVKTSCTLEYKAIQRTRRWYVEVFLPHVQKYDLPTNPALWRCEWWGKSEDAFALYTDKKSYPWVPYAEYYRQLRAER
jgi:hypothetical protein